MAYTDPFTEQLLDQQKRRQTSKAPATPWATPGPNDPPKASTQPFGASVVYPDPATIPLSDPRWQQPGGPVYPPQTDPPNTPTDPIPRPPGGPINFQYQTATGADVPQNGVPTSQTMAPQLNVNPSITQGGPTGPYTGVYTPPSVTGDGHLTNEDPPDIPDQGPPQPEPGPEPTPGPTPAPTTTPPTTPPAGTLNPATWVVQGGTPEGIKALYAELHLHPPTDDEVQKWLDGTYGGARTMAQVRAQMASSGEAQNNPANVGARTDPAYVRSVVDSWMQTHNTRGHADPDYWVRRILETGGLGQDNMNYWLGRFTEPEGTHVEGPTGGGGGGGSTTTTSSGSTTTTAPTSTPQNASYQRSPEAQKFIDQLIARSQQSLDVDPNDPVIKSQVNAFGAEQTRQARYYLRDLAEGGGPNSNLSAERRLAAQKLGSSVSGYQAQLMGQEVAARRQEIESALTRYGNFITSESQMKLQAELANLDRQQQWLMFVTGQSQQESQFARSLAENESQFGRNLENRAYEFDVNDQFRNSPLGS